MASSSSSPTLSSVPPTDPIAPSEAAESDYADSLATLTGSTAEKLFTFDGGSRFSALNDAYYLSYDDALRDVERLTNQINRNVNDGQLFPEPLRRRGEIEKMLNASSDSRVLDIGSGLEAIWATAVASKFPEVEVYAIDLIPVETRFVPQNLNTEVWDITDGLPYPEGYFNLIHIHCLLWWTPHMYQQTVLEALRCLRVGGVLIVEEPDGELKDADGQKQIQWVHSMYQDHSYSNKASALFGLLRELVESATLDDGGRFYKVEEEVFSNHVGPRTDIIQTPLQQENSLLLVGILSGFWKSQLLVPDLEDPTRTRTVKTGSSDLGSYLERIRGVDSGLYLGFKAIYALKK